MDRAEKYAVSKDRERVVAMMLAKQALTKIYKTGYVNKATMSAVVRALHALDETGLDLTDLD